MSHYVGYTESGFTQRCAALLASPVPAGVGIPDIAMRAARTVMIEAAEKQHGWTDDHLDPGRNYDEEERVAIFRAIKPYLGASVVDWQSLGVAINRERNMLRWAEDEKATTSRKRREFDAFMHGAHVPRVREAAGLWLDKTRDRAN